jgi:hypothetical protein
VLLLSHRVQILPASPAIKRADDVSQHDRPRCLIEAFDSGSLFQAGFVTDGKWLRQVAKMLRQANA